MFADNMSVVHNCSKPESQLKKKSNSIAYHYVRERCAGPRPVCCICYIPTQDNLADMFTKSQPGEVRKRLDGTQHTKDDGLGGCVRGP